MYAWPFNIHVQLHSYFINIAEKYEGTDCENLYWTLILKLEYYFYLVSLREFFTKKSNVKKHVRLYSISVSALSRVIGNSKYWCQTSEVPSLSIFFFFFFLEDLLWEESWTRGLQRLLLANIFMILSVFSLTEISIFIKNERCGTRRRNFIFW